MSGVLADTSIWVRYLRHGAEDPWGTELDRALEQGSLKVCGPVVAELMAGARRRERDELAAVFSGLDWIDLDRGGWLLVGRLAADLRAAGQTVPLTDVTIAAAAIETDAELVTADTDFERIAEQEPKLVVRLLSP